jgi:hypothetical protein
VRPSTPKYIFYLVILCVGIWLLDMATAIPFIFTVQHHARRLLRCSGMWTFANRSFQVPYRAYHLCLRYHPSYQAFCCPSFCRPWVDTSVSCTLPGFESILREVPCNDSNLCCNRKPLGSCPSLWSNRRKRRIESGVPYGKSYFWRLSSDGV